MSLCDKTCNGCAYSSKYCVGGYIYVCNFLLVTGKRRGCPAGNGCQQRIEGERAQQIDEMLFRGQKPKPIYDPSKKVDYHRKNQEKLQGRQREAIRAWCRENGWTHARLAREIGVSESTLRTWIKEYAPAQWDKLAAIGIRRPDMADNSRRRTDHDAGGNAEIH